MSDAGDEARRWARRQRRLGLVLGAALIVVVAAILISSHHGEPKPKPGERVAGQTAAATMLAGLPQQGDTLGSARAKVVLVEYGDLVCPVCKTYAEKVLPTIVADYVRTGKVRLELRPLAYVKPYSKLAAQYAWAAAAQDRMWAFTTIWYTNQLREDTDYVSPAFARQMAAGVPGLDADRMIADASGTLVRAQMAAAERGFDVANGQGTPTFTIGRAGGTQQQVDLGGTPSTAAAVLDKALAAA